MQAKSGTSKSTLFKKRYYEIGGVKLYQQQYKNDGREDTKFLLFAHPSLFHYFYESKHLLIDATFRSVWGLKSYSQVMVIAARIEKHGRAIYVPCCCIFMPKKSANSYTQAFKAIKKLCEGQTINAKIISTDWEPQIFSSFKKVFNTPGLESRRCVVHMLRNFEKKLRKLGIWKIIMKKTSIMNRFWLELKKVSYIF